MTEVDIFIPRVEDRGSVLNRDAVTAPNTPAGQAITRRREQDRRSNKQVFTDAVGEGARGIGKWVAGLTDDTPVQDWDRSKHMDLVEGLPREYWEPVLEATSLDAARMKRAELDADLRRLTRMGLDEGARGLLSTASSLVDVDAPLVLVSGGAFGAAKLAGATAYRARKLGLATGTADRLAGAAVGASGGLQAGALVGGGMAAGSEMHTWMDAVQVAFTMGVFGGTVGGAAPRITLPIQEFQDDFVRRVRAGDEALFNTPWNRMPNPSNESADILGAQRVLQDQIEEAGLVADPNWKGPILDLESSTSIPALDLTRGQSLSAAAVPGLRTYPALQVPQGISKAEVDVVQQSRVWHEGVGWKEQWAAINETILGRMSTWKTFGVGTHDVLQLGMSGSTVLNRMAGTIFEMPGRQVAGDTSTAALLRDKYTGRAMSHIEQVPSLMHRYAAETNRPLGRPLGINVGATNAAKAEFYRKVTLEMNARANGLPSVVSRTGPDRHIHDAATLYSNAGMETLGFMKGRNGEIPLLGSDLIPDKASYFPYSWQGGKIANIIAKGLVTEKTLVDAVAKGYQNAGTITNPDIAKAVASALVQRFKSRGLGESTHMQSLLTADGRAYIAGTMKGAGVKDADIQRIMKRFDKEITEARKQGNLKSRNEIDLSTKIRMKDGSEMQLVDLMDLDLDTVYQRYIRGMAGASALARKGINSRAAREDWINAANKEQIALGEEPINPNMIRAMFSEFDGGPQVGFARGEANVGIGAMAELKSLTSLSTLTFNGFAQAAETFIPLAAFGFNAWWKRGIGSVLDQAMRTRNKALLDEMAFFMGNIGRDQHHFRPHQHIDDAADLNYSTSKGAELARNARELISAGNYIQGYTSGLNTMRAWQQQVSALAASDDIIRRIAKGEGGIGSRLLRDFGITDEMVDEIQNLMAQPNSPIRMGKEQGLFGEYNFVDQLNLDQWPAALAEDFTSAISRSVAQQVQKAAAGEHSRWMYTSWGSLGTHLQTFPLLAVQKQFFRNATHKDGQAAIAGVMALAGAYIAVRLRDLITGRERDSEETFRAAIGYSNLMGWMPLYTDPIMSIMGLNDLRVNQFGPYSKPLSVPALDVGNSLFNAVGGLPRTIAGTGDWSDKQSARAVPFVRLIEAMGRLSGVGDFDTGILNRMEQGRLVTPEEELRQPNEEAGILPNRPVGSAGKVHDTKVLKNFIDDVLNGEA